jgi:hypothetical protein
VSQTTFNETRTPTLMPGTTAKDEEMLVPDARGQLTPAQVVEHRLAAMMDTCPVLVSHLQDSVKRRPR